VNSDTKDSSNLFLSELFWEASWVVMLLEVCGGIALLRLVWSMSIGQNGKRLRKLNEQLADAREEVERLGELEEQLAGAQEEIERLAGLRSCLSTCCRAPILKFCSFHLYASKLFAIFAVLVAVVGLPSYHAGARWYECGDMFVHTTAAYLFDVPRLELLIAFMVISCSLLASLSVVQLMCQYSNHPSHHKQNYHIWHRCKFRMNSAMLWLVYLLALTPLAMPTVLYVASHTFPANNIIFDTESVWVKLVGSHVGYPCCLLAINTMILPRLARYIVLRLGTTGDASKFILIGRLMITIVVPIISVIYLDQGCYRGFMQFWTPCMRGESDFDFPNGCDPAVSDPIYSSYCSVTRAAVCTVGFRHGKCSRRVLELYSVVWTQKLCIAAFLQPAISLFRHIPSCSCSSLPPKLLQVLQLMFPRLGGVNPDIKLDEEWAQILSVLELAIFAGPFVPALIPLAACCLWSNQMVVMHLSETAYGNTREGCMDSLQRVGVPLEDGEDSERGLQQPDSDAASPSRCKTPQTQLQDIDPPIGYLFISIMMLSVFSIWFFWDNSFGGRHLVLTLASSFLFVPMAFCWFHWRAAHQTHTDQSGPLMAQPKSPDANLVCAAGEQASL